MRRIGDKDYLQSDLATLTSRKAEQSQAEKMSADRPADRSLDRSNRGYSVDISSESKSTKEARQKATEIARNTPDVRSEKVANLKKQIENGTYKPDAGKIADGILREAIKDRLAQGD